uniref:DNA-directed RNA polymerase subunit beta' n=1 Tax=Chlorosarcinopsis eremi TaxID=332213 RepID=A0A5C2FR57_9CHLO|nr:RNA polymerase beta' subunit [Chlorosarcinopsis eremi]
MHAPLQNLRFCSVQKAKLFETHPSVQNPLGFEVQEAQGAHQKPRIKKLSASSLNSRQKPPVIKKQSFLKEPVFEPVFERSELPVSNKKIYTSYSKLSEVKLLTIGIASPLRILQWAEKTLPNGKIYGEVLNANTLHHKTFKPQKGGLFCERIFGPLKDFECACGKIDKSIKYDLRSLRAGASSVQEAHQATEESETNQTIQVSKTVNSKPSILKRSVKNRKYCPECDVEYTWSVIRRYQLGYIKLNSPVTHVWFLKGTPSYLSILLDFKKRHLQNVTYCSETLTVENALFQNNKLMLLDSPSKIFTTWQSLVNKSTLPSSATEPLLSPKPLVKTTPRLDINKESTSQIAESSTERSSSGVQKPSVVKKNGVFFEETVPTPLDRRSGVTMISSYVQAKEKLKHRRVLHQQLSPLPYSEKGTTPLKKWCQNITSPISQNNSIKKEMGQFPESEADKYKEVSYLSEVKKSKNKLSSYSQLSTSYQKPSVVKGRSNGVASSFEEMPLSNEQTRGATGLVCASRFSPSAHSGSSSKSAMKGNTAFLLNKSSQPFLLSGSSFLSNKKTSNTKMLDVKKGSFLLSFLQLSVYYNTSLLKSENYALASRTPPLLASTKYVGFCREAQGTGKEKTHFLKEKASYTPTLKEISQKLPVDFYILSSLERLLHKQALLLSINKTWEKIYKKAYLNAMHKAMKIAFLAPALFPVSLSKGKGKEEVKSFSSFYKRKKTVLQKPLVFEEALLLKTSAQNINLLLKMIKKDFNNHILMALQNLKQPVLALKHTTQIQNSNKQTKFKVSSEIEQYLILNTEPITKLLSDVFLKSFLVGNFLEKMAFIFNKKSALLAPALLALQNPLGFEPKGALRASVHAPKGASQKALLFERYKIEDFVTVHASNAVNFPLDNPLQGSEQLDFEMVRGSTKIDDFCSEDSDNLKANKYNTKKDISSKFQKNCLNLYKNLIRFQKLKKTSASNFVSLPLPSTPSSFSLARSAKEKKAESSAKKVKGVLRFAQLFKKNGVFFDKRSASSLNSQKPKETQHLLNSMLAFFPSFTSQGRSNKGNAALSQKEKAKKYVSFDLSESMNKSEYLDNKNKVYNNVYVLSHRERWSSEKDWQLFSLYNSGISEYTDIPIHTYKNRLSLNWCFAMGEKTAFQLFSELPSLRFAPIAKSAQFYARPAFGKGTVRVGEKNEPKEKLEKMPTKEEFTVNYTLSSAFYSGAGIVQQLLNELNFAELKKLDKQNRLLLYQLNKTIFSLKKQAQFFIYDKSLQLELRELCKKRDFLIRRTKLVRKFFRKDSDPSSMVLTVLPVLPPDLRPIVKMGNQIAASDLNRLYQRVIYRNDRLKKFLKDPATSHSYEMKYAQRLLQEAVDNLIQNGKSGVNSEKDSRGRLLKSLSDLLKGKQGRFRQFLLGKRVDYSGRSVIVVGPKLKLYECGIPLEMAKELYLPFLLKSILNKNYARTVIGAKSLIKNNPALAHELLRDIMRVSPVFLNRAPTLHRLGIQAFVPKLVEGRAILLHPLVCSAFNADFDGDQMAVHVPITVEARAEAWKLMLARNNIFSPATGEPLAIPSQDMVLGCYFLTTYSNPNNARMLPAFSKGGASREGVQGQTRSTSRFFFDTHGSGLFFNNLYDVLNAYNRQKIHLHALVWVKWLDSIENGNDQEEPIEIRMASNGHWQEISANYHRFYDSNNILISQYMATTPGRILFNLLIQKIL